MGIYRHALEYKRLLDIVPSLVDEHTGIIGSLEQQPRQENMPAFFYYIARGANTSALIPSGYAATTAGVSVDRDIAMCKAAGEAVERYCGGIYEEAQLGLSSFARLKGSAIDPAEFALFSKRQYEQQHFPFAPFGQDTVLRWVEGTDLTAQTPAWVPACFVYVPYEHAAGETFIWPGGSTGLAAHCSFEEAALNGILEVMERDCVMITWLAMLQRPLLDKDSLTGEHLDLIGRFESLGYSVQLIDIRNETQVPAVMGILQSHGATDLVQFACSAAVHLDPVHAVRKCLEELCLMERYTRRAMLTDWEGSGEKFAGMRSFFDHVKLYNTGEFRSHAQFLTASTWTTRLDAMQNFESGNTHADLDRITGMIGQSGHRVVTVDVTTEDIASLGMCVVRAIVPGYHPHLPGFLTRPLGGNRLLKMPQQLGYTGIAQQDDANPFPHPFA